MKIDICKSSKMEKLKLAIQKSGRLSEKSLALIKGCGIKYRSSSKKLVASCDNFPLEILFLRDDDIPGYVEDGVADIGIVGQNVIEEKNNKVIVKRELGFSRCRLSIAIPREQTYSSIKDLDGKSIATSYPVILSNFLKESNVKADIQEISGSVEIAPSIGLADAICDIVSTGSTLISNGLKEVETIFKSQAVLVAAPNLSDEKGMLLARLLFRMQALENALNHKYIVLNAPNDSIQEIKGILPGIKSPSITPLADSEWSSVSSVINENDFWEVIEQLKAVGAEGILVMPIEKMIY